MEQSRAGGECQKHCGSIPGLGKKVEKLIANAKREVEESLIKSLEQNLKENLAKDTIERMNIPEVLKKLSSIGAKQVTETSLPE